MIIESNYSRCYMSNITVPINFCNILITWNYNIGYMSVTKRVLNNQTNYYAIIKLSPVSNRETLWSDQSH